MLMLSSDLVDCDYQIVRMERFFVFIADGALSKPLPNALNVYQAEAPNCVEYENLNGARIQQERE
jgi:hypothetical protein